MIHKNSSTTNTPIILKKKLDFNLLEGTSKEVIDSLIMIHEKNKEFFEVLHKIDLIKLENLLRENYPKSFSSILEEDLDRIKGSVDSFSDDWDDVINEIFYEGVKEVCSKPENENVLSLFANYSTNKNDFSKLIRSIYFCYMQNEKEALNYARLLYKDCSYLNNEHHHWMGTILLNENNDLFDEFFEIHKKYSKVILGGYKLIDSLIYSKNIKSSYWIKYFDYYIDSFIKQEQVNYLHIDKTLGPMNSVYYFLLEKVESKPVLKNHILAYYNNKLEREYDFSELSLIVLDKKMKQFSHIYELDTKNNLKQNLRSVNSKKNIIKNLEIKLFKAVKYLINEKSPSQCYEIFKCMSLDEKYYQPIVLMKNLEDLNNCKNLKIKDLKNSKI